MAKVTHWAAKTWRVVSCGIDLDSKPNTIHTDDTAKVTCKRCPNTRTFRQFAIPSNVEASTPARPVTVAPMGTPCGWTAYGETGTRLTCQGGRDAIHVLTKTLPVAVAGTALCAYHSPYDPTDAEREAVGQPFQTMGEAGAEIRAKRAEEVAFTVTKEDILTRPGRPIDSLLNSGVKAPAVTNGDRFIWSEDGSEYEVVGLRNRGAQDELVIFSSGESLFMDRLKAMIIDGRMVPNSGCRSLNHVYCVGPCPERDRNEANASATRTHVETEAECLARIQREDFRVGDAYTFRNMTGYRLHQDRPFSCRGLKCQCGKACHGTMVESPEILTDVAHYVSGGLEIRGDKGSRAVIRPDRLD